MFTGGLWRNLAMSLVVCAGFVGADTAYAAPGSAICRSIEAQLSRGGGGSNRRFSAAAERQRKEIGKIRGQMAAAGCGFLNNSPRCANLSRLASRMNANLSQLSAKSGGSGKSRAQLLAALEANECRGVRKREQRRENSQGIIARLFGEPAPSPRRVERPKEQLSFWRQSEDSFDKLSGREAPRRSRERRAAALPVLGNESGKVRTFCVRTCDGYYFPMSPASSSGDMERDEQNCRAACPGADTALYYHEAGQEDAEAMMSRMTGQRYADLNTAFVYRDAGSLKSPQCTCAAQPGTLKPVVAAVDAEAEASQKYLPLPANRPDPNADAETLANLDGDLTAAAIRRMLSGDTDPEIAQRPVRVVGPMFLPDPEVAASPQAQAPIQAR